LVFTLNDMEALFGFAGVIVGALLTFLLERLRASRQRAADAQAAALILASELTEALAAIDFFIEDVRPIDPQLVEHLRSTWRDSRPPLAPALGDDEFLKLTLAISTVDEVAHHSRADGPAPDTEHLDHLREHVAEASGIVWDMAKQTAR
jgi:hypothetical protein